MSDMTVNPQEVVSSEPEPRHSGVQIIEARAVPLGGVRAMTVRRTLPHRERRTIGAWCFLDHYGPDDVRSSEGMFVPPHPHTGLQTVSWLFRGEIEHRDALGSHQLIEPGEMNLMTAGRGISHSEVSTDRDPVLHGVQLWTVLPKSLRNMAPEFSHTVAVHQSVLVTAGDVQASADIYVFLGELGLADDLTLRANAQGFSPLMGAEIVLPPFGELTAQADAAFEYGLLVDSGEATLNGAAIGTHALGVVDVGARSLRITAGAEGARLVLIGGEPLHEPFVMWWNFIGASHDDVVAAREAWMAEVFDRYDGEHAGVADSTASPASAGARFVDVPGFDGPPLPAPVMPASTLKAR